ncbi:MAG: hypothetical protein KGL39_34590 [Patescibacteria group bacterium]|nr:hypothetical protein [Patescibacteria group bacterium]
MSYDIDLIDPETSEPCVVANHEEGGTYRMGGTTEASLNVTYNYSPFYGKKASETAERLRAAVAKLGTSRHHGGWMHIGLGAFQHPDKDVWLEKLKHADLEAPHNALLRAEAIAAGVVEDGGGYWKPTPGNAGYALSILLSWAIQHPNGVWQGD